MTKIEPRLLKGFRDYAPEQQLARQNMFASVQSVFERFGFLPLSTPVLEYKEILMGKYGDEEKLVYSFKDNGDRDVAMRYDLTVPLARFVAQNQGQLVFPFKRYQIAPVWRAENTQKGRLREFYQCDVDAVGTDSPVADAEVIACLCQALESLGVTNYKVRLNDRSTLGGLSIEALRGLDKLEKIGLDGVLTYLKENNVAGDEIEKIEAIASGKSEIPQQIKILTALIQQLGISGEIEYDPSIARGLDYYTGTVFEIVLTDQPEYGSVCGGGRYDGLVDQFSDQPLPAVGGSIGVDRLIDALREKGEAVSIVGVKALILNLDDKLIGQYAKLAASLRDQGVAVEMYYEAAKLDKQFKYAESKNMPYAIIMGEEEIAKGTVQLKNLQDRTQEELPQTEVVTKLL